jgi:hypothetical protein
MMDRKVVSRQHPVVSREEKSLLATGYRLLVFSCWLLTTGYWLLLGLSPLRIQLASLSVVPQPSPYSFTF